MFSNSCLVFNLNYYKFVVLDVHTLLIGILKPAFKIRAYAANATRFTDCPERRSRHTKSKRCDTATVIAGDAKRTTLYIQLNIYVTQPKKIRQDTLTNGV